MMLSLCISLFFVKLARIFEKKKGNRITKYTIVQPLLSFFCSFNVCWVIIFNLIKVLLKTQLLTVFLLYFFRMRNRTVFVLIYVCMYLG
ncbi:hypothetical protein ACP275_09G109700 [Erythranthe tilingii]